MTHRTKAIETAAGGPDPERGARHAPTHATHLATAPGVAAATHPRRHAVVAVTVIVVLYGALAVFGFWGAWGHGPAQYATSGGGDQAASMWFLTWAPFSILHGHNPLFSDYGNHPFGINMIVNTSTLPLGLLVAPVTMAVGAVVSFNLVGTLAPVLSACAAYLLIRRFTAWRPAAFVGGLLYGFSPYVVAEGLGHLMTVFVPLPPLILLVVHDIVVRQPGKPVVRGVALGLMLVVQFFISSEVLTGTIMIAVVAVALGALFGRDHVREHLRYAARALASGALLVVVVLAYPVWFMLRGPASVVGPVQQAPQLFRADLLGPLYPDLLMHFAPASLANVADHFAGNGTENGSYLGAPLVLLLVVAVIALWRVVVVRIAALTGLFAFVLSLGSRLMIANHPTFVRLPEGLFDKLPLLDNTVPVRFSLYVALCAAVILGIVVDRVHGAWRWRRSRVLAVAVPMALAVVVLAPLVPAWPYPMQPVEVPAYFTSGAADAIAPDAVVLVYPFPDATFANPQVWQTSTFLRFKMPGGRFNVPQAATGVAGASRASLTDAVLSAVAAGRPPARSAALRGRLVTQLRSWGVRDVVAVPTAIGFPGALSFLTWMLGRPPKMSAGAAVWYDWR